MQLLLGYEIGRCANCGRPIYFGEELDSCNCKMLCRGCCEDFAICERCGEIVPSYEAAMIEDGWLLCGNCFENGTYECECCGGKYYCETSVHETVDGGYVCDYCANRKYEKCFDCGNYFPTSKGVEIGNIWFCSGCSDIWTVCDDCDYVVRRDETCATASGSLICAYCRENHYVRCCHCEELIHEDESCCVDGECYCSECAPESSDRENVFGYHGWNGVYRRRQMDGESPSEPTFGVELEADGGNFDYDQFAGWADDGLIHFEEDGSLSCDGVECISQPCTLRYHLVKFPWREICEELVSQGFRSHDTKTCGLHVHIGRNEVSPLTFVKMDFLINHENWFFKKLSRRSDNSYCEYEYRSMMLAQKGKQEGDHCDRYHAVNTTNEETVEIRIFKGTLKTATLLGCVELCHALVKFLPEISMKELVESSGNVVAKLVDYAGRNLKTYPNLIRMMGRLVPENQNVKWWIGKIGKKGSGKCA